MTGADTQLKQLEESITFATKQIDDESNVLEELRGQLESLRGQVDDKREAFDGKKLVVEQLRSAYQQEQRRQFEAEKKVAVADTSIMNLQRSVQQVQEEGTQRAAQVAQLGTEKQDAEGDLQENHDKLQELVTRHEEVKGKILQGQEEVETLRAQLVDENRKLDSRRNEHDLLKSLVESLEGYPDSIKFLKKNKEWNNEAPLLSDVFVVQNEYRTALENLLDNYLNYYVVNNVGEAAQAVHLLDTNKKGKANFFILDQFQQYKPSAHAAPANAIPALSVVTVDEQYMPLAQHLLGHVYIANDGADVATNDLQNGFVLVEKAG